MTVLLLSVGITLWVINYYIFPKKFDPVVLNQRETIQLDEKLEKFSWVQNSTKSSQRPALQAEKYSEKGVTREISLSEREVNALLAKNTNLANKLAIDLSDNLASGKLLVPMCIISVSIERYNGQETYAAYLVLKEV